jgi:hypothetical protein
LRRRLVLECCSADSFLSIGVGFIVVQFFILVFVQGVLILAVVEEFAPFVGVEVGDVVENQSSKTIWYCGVMAPDVRLSTSGTVFA